MEDICRSFLAILEAPRELVHNEAFNVGREKDNVQVRDIAEIVRAAVPGSTVTLAADAGPDLRDYRVDFSKLTGTFPELRLRWDVPAGVDQLVQAYSEYGFRHEDFVSSTYVRLRRIRELLSEGSSTSCCAAGAVRRSTPLETAQIRARRNSAHTSISVDRLTRSASIEPAISSLPGAVAPRSERGGANRSRCDIAEMGSGHGIASSGSSNTIETSSIGSWGRSIR